MEAYFKGTGVIDLVLALTLVEAAALLAYHRITGRGPSPRDYALNMVSGLCLMLALRSALAGAGWHWIALSLLASGLAHASDIYSRWGGRK
jgi:hypothetical protein